MRYVGLLIVLFLSVSANAVEGVISYSYGKSGSSLHNATGGQKYNIRGGEGYVVSFGALLPVSPTHPHRFEVQATAGFMIGVDGNVDWYRCPLEAIYFYRNTQELFRIGYGPTYHVWNRISGNEDPNSVSSDVNNSLGWVISAEKLVIPKNGDVFLGFGLRYNFIRYHSPGLLESISGNGLYLTYSVIITNSRDSK